MPFLWVLGSHNYALALVPNKFGSTSTVNDLEWRQKLMKSVIMRCKYVLMSLELLKGMKVLVLNQNFWYVQIKMNNDEWFSSFEEVPLPSM